jgi:hypothetical protein
MINDHQTLQVEIPEEGYYAGNSFITKSDFLKYIESVPDDFMFIQTCTDSPHGKYLSVSIHQSAFGGTGSETKLIWQPSS